jgi:hypothetical protein
VLIGDTLTARAPKRGSTKIAWRCKLNHVLLEHFLSRMAFDLIFWLLIAGVVVYGFRSARDKFLVFFALFASMAIGGFFGWAHSDLSQHTLMADILDVASRFGGVFGAIIAWFDSLNPKVDRMPAQRKSKPSCKILG